MKPKPPTITGTVSAGGRKYKYSADIKLKAEVIWHIRPKNKPDTARATEPVQKVELVDKPTGHTTRWEKTVSQEGVVVAVVSLVFYAAYRAAELFAGKGMMRPTTLPPFIHKIDPRNVSGEA